MNSVRKEKAAVSLTLMMSTAAGVLFTFLFFNVSQYIAASAAVKEAARKAVRCLSPTDPECVQLSADTALSGTQEWFGYENASSEDSSTVVVQDIYRYWAEMPTISWSARYSLYEFHRAHQPLRWSTLLVPVRRFVPLVQPLSLRSNRVFTFPYFVPVNGYPRFEQDESATPDQWQAAVSAPFQWKDLGTREILSGGVERFESGDIHVPELPFLPDAPCVDRSEAACGAAEQTGDASAVPHWRDTAHLAIKVISDVTATSGRPSVSWGNPRALQVHPYKDGLFVRTWDKNGNELPPRALGGRDWEAVSGSRGYNLWLRGPKGAHGGNADYQHHHIEVPRGGKFRVEAILAVRRGAVHAHVNVGYYYDNYTVELLTEQCQVDGECPQASSCQDKLSERMRTALNQPAAIRNWQAGGCSTETVPGTPQPRAGAAVTAAVCSDSWSPAPPSLGTNERFAGWERTEVSRIEVPGADGGCSLGQVLRRGPEDCSVDPIAGRPVDAALCGNFAAHVAPIERRAEQLNASQPAGAPRFSARVVPELLEQRLAVVRYSWTPEDENGASLRPGEAVRIVKELIQPQSWIERFKKQSGVEEAPVPEDFRAAVFRENAGAEVFNAHRYNPQDEISVYRRGEGKLAITGAVPFDAPVPEIYWGQHDSAKGWDFNLDCRPDASCPALPAEQRFENESAMLRARAAVKYPQAASSYGYVFESGSQWAAQRVYGEIVTRADAAGFAFGSSCPTVRMACSNLRTSTSGLVLLGRYSSTPPQCVDGRYFDCFARPSGAEQVVSFAAAATDEQRVREIALNDLRTAVPAAQSGALCDAGGVPACASVEIKYLDGGRRAAVTVGYELPLTFPLSTILGRESMPLRQTKEEVLERAVIATHFPGPSLAE